MGSRGNNLEIEVEAKKRCITEKEAKRDKVQ